MADKRIDIQIDANVSGQADVDKLGKGLDAMGREAADAGSDSAAGARGIGQIGREARTAAPGIRQTADALRDAGNAAEQGESKFGATRRGLISISQQLDQTRQHLANMRDQLIAGFTFNEFVQAAAQMEQVQAGLQAVSGDSRLAGEQMEFVRRMATAAGVDVVSAGQAFLGLAAATKGTAVEGEPARRVFESVTLAMAKAGKSSAETQNALLALSQIASKGTVSMEELRGQLGEALPGALQAAANGLGITTQDLIKLVENGQLAAEDLFPALAKGLDDLYSGAPAAQTLSQEITNIKNAFVEMSANLGEAGGLDALKVGAEVAQSAITLLGDTLIQTGQYIGTLAAAVTTLDFSGVSDAFAQIERDSQERLLKAAEHNDVLRNALKASSSEAVQAAIAQREQAAAAAGAGQQSVAAAGGVAALGVAYTKVREEVQKQLDLATREVEAVKARGEAGIAHAAALGDEQAKREAIAQAAASEAAAMVELAAKRQLEVDVMTAELAGREALLAKGGEVSEQRKKEIADLKQLIAQKQIDADKTRAQAAASEEKARTHSKEALAAQAATSAAQASAISRAADAKATLSGLQAQKELARQTEEMARLMGNETAAREAKIQQLQIEAKILVAKANVSKIEAEGSIAVAQANLVELKAKWQLTAVKEAELNASIKLAQAKIAEANATAQGAGLLQRQIDLLRQTAGAASGAGNAANQAAEGFRNMGEAAGAAADNVKRLTDANNRYSSPLGPNKYGSPRTGGSTYGNTREERLAGQGASDETLRFALLQKLQAGTLSQEDLPGLIAVVQTLKNNEEIFRNITPGGNSLEALEDDAKWRNARTGFEQAIARFGGGGGQGVGRPVNMTVNVGGKRFKAQAGSEQDAQQMVRALEQAASRS